MFAMLMKKDTPVCKLFLGCLSLSGVIVYRTDMIDQSLLPFSCTENPQERELKSKFRDWFESRVTANSDPALDETMQEIYGLDQVHYGRMYNYQYLGAFMAYMVSGFDDYWVNPTHPQVLTYSLVDPYFYQWIRLPTSKRSGRRKGKRAGLSKVPAVGTALLT